MTAIAKIVQTPERVLVGQSAGGTVCIRAYAPDAKPEAERANRALVVKCLESDGYALAGELADRDGFPALYRDTSGGLHIAQTAKDVAAGWERQWGIGEQSAAKPVTARS